MFNKQEALEVLPTDRRMCDFFFKLKGLIPCILVDNIIILSSKVMRKSLSLYIYIYINLWGKNAMSWILTHNLLSDSAVH
jgi:hypothetical protein